MLRKNVKN
jgi:hypothetical protein